MLSWFFLFLSAVIAFLSVEGSTLTTKSVKHYPLLKFHILQVPSLPAVISLRSVWSKQPAVILVLTPGGPWAPPNFDIKRPSSISQTAINPPSSAETTDSNSPLLRANATSYSWEVLISSYVLNYQQLIFLEPNNILLVIESNRRDVSLSSGRYGILSKSVSIHA